MLIPSQLTRELISGPIAAVFTVRPTLKGQGFAGVYTLGGGTLGVHLVLLPNTDAGTGGGGGRTQVSDGQAERFTCTPTSGCLEKCGAAPRHGGKGGQHGHTHSCLLGLLPARVNPWIVGLEVPEALRGGCAYRCEFLECRLNKQ